MHQLKITKQITSAYAPLLNKYLQEISKIKLLTDEEEIYLTKRIQEGDDMALERLVKSNLRFVVSVAKQYQNNGLNLLDLINEGNIGLIKAARRFDVTKGFKFISYAVWWIRQSVLQALSEKSHMVRIPQNKIRSINKADNIFSILEQKLQREPTSEEIANILDVSTADVKDYLKAMSQYVSIDVPAKDNEGLNSYDKLLSEDVNYGAFDNSLKKDINCILSILSEREAKIVRLYYGLSDKPPYSLEGIGDIMNLTRERVRQIKENAVKQLKEKYISSMLRDYLS